MHHLISDPFSWSGGGSWAFLISLGSKRAWIQDYSCYNVFGWLVLFLLMGAWILWLWVGLMGWMERQKKTQYGVNEPLPTEASPTP
eukprot:12192990-Ditylum_brightwellii.AAC.1